MSDWRVVIADDEPAARRGVRQLLAPFTSFTIVGECRNGAETLTAIEQLRPHLLFLDIQMPGLDGFDVLRRARPIPMPLTVFLTAWEQFAVKAFEAEAVDYLLKPVSEERFERAVRRVERHLRGQQEARLPMIRIQGTRGIRLLPLAEVEWIEAAGNYARLWTRERGVLHRESLSELEPRLREAGFVRLHRGAIVRLDCVRSLMKENSGSLVVVLDSGVRIPVARRRRAAVSAALDPAR